jgi:hypothetical protein
MENVEKKECECGMHSMGGHGCHGGKCHLVKIILKIFIVILIFWCGFKLGDMTGSIRSESGHRMMNRGNFGMMHENSFGNMPNANIGAPTTAPTPTPAK